MGNLAISNMATRNAAGMPGRTEPGTDFQLHNSGSARNIIDFTEHKLIRYAMKCNDAQQKLILMALVEDYRKGLVAISWRRGLPVPLRVTKDT